MLRINHARWTSSIEETSYKLLNIIINIMQCEQIPPAPNDIYKSFKLLHWKISVLKYQMWEQFTEKTLGKDN